MKKQSWLFTLVLILSFGVRADPPAIEAAGTVEIAKAQAEEKCKQGCLILSPSEIAQLKVEFEKQYEQAYQNGLRGWNHSS